MLRGKHVILRTLEREDVETLWRHAQDVELMLLAMGAWKTRPMARYEHFFEEDIKDPPPDEIPFGIEVDGVLIGSIELHRIDWRSRTAELGMHIGEREYLGKGYGTDAIRTLLPFAFRVQNLRRLWLATYAHNERALKAYLSCGFKEEGCLRQHEWVGGTYVDVVHMGLLRDEWQTSSQPNSW
jgi:diamine N-acetyltransferase